MKGRKGSGVGIESADRFSSAPRSSHLKLKILKYASIFASVLMGCIAFTAVYIGPTRFSDEVSEAFNMHPTEGVEKPFQHGWLGNAKHIIKQEGAPRIRCIFYIILLGNTSEPWETDLPALRPL
jgi:hypothetical protein